MAITDELKKIEDILLFPVLDEKEKLIASAVVVINGYNTPLRSCYLCTG